MENLIMNVLDKLIVSSALISFSVVSNATMPSKHLAQNITAQTIHATKSTNDALHTPESKHRDTKETHTNARTTICEHTWCASLVSDTHPLHALVPEAWVLYTPMLVLNQREPFTFEYSTALQWKNTKLTYSYLPNYSPKQDILWDTQITTHNIWLQAFTQRNFAYILKPYVGVGGINFSASTSQLSRPLKITIPYTEIGVKTEHTVVNLYVGLRNYGKFFIHQKPFDVEQSEITKLPSKIVFNIEYPLVRIGLK
jgi:hypothetical protein